MRFKLQLVLERDEPEKKDITLDIATFNKDFTRPEHIGLSVSDAKNVLQNLQKTVVEEQINKFLQSHSHCSLCQDPLTVKENRKIKYRTLYGTLDVKSPRYYLCKCQGLTRKSMTPLLNLLDDHTSPELCYLEAKWSSLMSYGLTVDLLKDSFPIDEKLSIETVRKNTLNIAKKINGLLGEEKHVYATPFAKADPVAFNNESTIVGLDGGYLRSWSDKKTHFELIVGKSIPNKGNPRVLGLVSSQDEKPKRRLFEVLESQGIKDSDGVCFREHLEGVVARTPWKGVMPLCEAQKTR